LNQNHTHFILIDEIHENLSASLDSQIGKINTDMESNLYYIVFGGEIQQIHRLMTEENMQHEFIFIQVSVYMKLFKNYSYIFSTNHTELWQMREYFKLYSGLFKRP
jgi:hypothetical protein